MVSSVRTILDLHTNISSGHHSPPIHGQQDILLRRIVQRRLHRPPSPRPRMRAHVPVHECRPVPRHGSQPRLLFLRLERSQCDRRHCLFRKPGCATSGLSKPSDGRRIDGRRSRCQPHSQSRVYVDNEHDEVSLTLIQTNKLFQLTSMQVSLSRRTMLHLRRKSQRLRPRRSNRISHPQTSVRRPARQKHNTRHHPRNRVKPGRPYAWNHTPQWNGPGVFDP